MKYIFFGTPEFASIILEKLIKDGVPPVALVCNPDKPVGRKKVITPPPAKVVAEKGGIKVFQPERLDEEFLKQLRELGAYLYVVAAYAKILKKNLLDIPRLGVIGVHPSPLPKYRGSSPIQTAIMNQEKETGVSLFMIDEKIDHGPVLSTRNISIAAKNYKELEKALAELSAEMLIEVLPRFAKGEIKPIVQNESEATFTKKFETEDGLIEYSDLDKAQKVEMDLARKINAKIKALNPEPGAYTIKDGKRIKLLNSRVTDRLELLEIQPEGKKPSPFKGVL